MSVGPSPSTSSTTPSTAPSATSSGTGWPKLTRGEIPSTWSKPAEVVSTLPSRAKPATSATGPIVGVVIALSTAAIVFVALPTSDLDRRPRPDSVAPPVAVAPGAIPAPPTTSSTTPTALAPEDQGGDLVAPSSNPAPAPTSKPPTSTPPPTSSAPASTKSATTAAPIATTTTALTATAPSAASTPSSATTNASTSTSTTASTSTPASTSTVPTQSATTASAKPTTLGALPAASVDDPPLETGGITELPARKKAKALTARAIASLRDGDVSGAEPALVRAVLIDPSHADAWRHLGIARAQLGDLDGARRAYRKYLELAPKAPDAAQVRAILAQ